MEKLTSQAYPRIQAALRPHTASGYNAKFKLYLAFIMFFGVSSTAWQQISHSYQSYSVLSHYFKLFDIETKSLNHRKVQLFIKFVSINSPYAPKIRGTFTIPLLYQLASACNSIRYGKVYKASFLLAYFAFQRLSNIVPVSANSFDPTHHFLRRDVIFGPPGAHIILKWAKAMQSSSKHQVIQIPLLPHSPLCPVTALKHLLQYVPAPSSAPLFLLPRPSASPFLLLP